MVILSVITKTKGEIGRFFKGEQNIDNDIFEWIYVYKDDSKSINILKKYINRSIKYDVSIWVQIDDGELSLVKKENVSRIVSSINNNSSV